MDRRSLVQVPFSPTQDVHVSGIIDHSHVTSYALTPTLRAAIGPWQASLSATGSDSRTFLDAYDYDSGVAFHSHALYEDNLKGGEATGEGPLFALPGGSARLAVGAGFRTLWLHDRRVTVTASQDIPVHNFTPVRNVQFAYGELSLPLVGPDVHFPFVDRLTLSAALRYEHWKAIASVTTPKFGLIYQPVSDVTLRATWGKSFKIPTLYEIYQPEAGAVYPGSFFTPPPMGGGTVLVLAGSAPNLKPERATSWSTTVELKPRSVPGLQFQATYFHIDFRDRIAKPLSTALSALYNPLYNDLITYNPSAAQVNAAIAPLTGGLFNFTGAPLDLSGVAAIIDESTRNTERQRIHGVDLNADYRFDLGQGSRLTLTGAASYLQSKQQLAADQPLLPLAGTIFHPPHWRGRAGAVWDKNQTGLSAFVNYLGATIDNTFRTLQSVPPFVTLDLSASVRTSEKAGPLSKVELRVSALNVLNEKPHHIRSQFPETAPYDSTNESPVGRFIGASLRKVW
jgi:outer membrane receptor protein involved in Fe transport